jgi:hypothetical protein
MAKGRKNKTPSRLRYERDHPTVSLRIPQKLSDTLRIIKEAEGKSIKDVLEAGAGLLEVKVRQEEEIRVQAYEEGWEKGIAEAEELYAVPYRCSICGKEIVVTTDEEKRAIKTYMREHGWGHAECINRRR